MKKNILNIRLIACLIIAHSLIFFSFHDKTIFWYIFTGSVLVLIALAMFQGDVDDEVSFIQYIFLGVLTGLLLYFVFWLGFQAIQVLHLPFEKTIKQMYRWYAPHVFWQYIALILVAAPGEELFWRGFIQKKFIEVLKSNMGHFISSDTLRLSQYLFWLDFAGLLGLFSGLVWGFLYFWKKSMPLVIVSHIIFDIMIFIILPFK